MIWIRLTNDIYCTLKLYDSQGKEWGQFSGGYRRGNTYFPDGGFTPSVNTDGARYQAAWLAVPLPQRDTTKDNEKFYLIGGYTNHSKSNFISGIAFSQNPWNVAYNPAISYYQALNGGDKITDPAIKSNEDGDNVGYLKSGKTFKIMVPVVYSGKDKLLFFVVKDNVFPNAAIFSITINGNPAQTLRSTYDNPISRHYINGSTVLKTQYFATYVPVDWIKKDDHLLEVVIDRTKQPNNFPFRGIGTHDAY